MAELNADSQSRLIQYEMYINEGQYASLADHLIDLQTAIERSDQSDVKNLTATALQICMLCQQCQNEIAWHDKANQEIRFRLRDLKRQLITLLSSIIEYESQKDMDGSAVSVTVTLLQDHITSRFGERTNIWQRIGNLLNLKSAHPSPERQRSKVEVDVKVNSPVEKVEYLTYIDNGYQDLPTPPIVEHKPDVCLTTDEDEITTPLRERSDSVEPVKARINSDRDDQLKDSTSAPKIDVTDLVRDAPPSLMVHCLGPFRVYQNDQLITGWQSSKGKAVFKYLVTHHDRPIAKEILMELFWPETSPEAARNNLNVAIYGLRQTLRESHPSYSHILYREESYLLNPEIDIWLDSEWFIHQVTLAQSQEQLGDLIGAIELYNNAEALWLGEFMEEDRYEDWLIAHRQLLTEKYLNLLDRLCRYYFDQGDYNACTTVCRKILGVDSCREEAHRKMMQCFHLQGQPYLALRQYQQCDEALKTELQVTPSSATKELFKVIRSQIGG